ncbi:serine/threonine protein kinase [[Mycobacterium] wendilense]|uniref:Serine/threonine protein kinase n=1 Tax=[Mycobacterium] wendilense TaxID=3064284 RepID=A0ABM9MCI6_9MYCO|nr:serine/threonine protein kinase [Mycolicibacterium sp. MU0050]CAJ1581916.1 serine/threonine protein kinase [Mycolicibacterium sp. MU0050]
MSRTRVNRSIYAVGAVLALVGALLLGTPAAGLAHAGPAGPAGTAISIGDPAAPGQVDLYLDPLCLYSGKMIQAQGEEIGRRIEAGTLHVNVRFVDFLDKDSASGSYDYRAIYAAYVVAGQSASSAVTWNFIREIFAAENQPRRHGPTDLSNDQLAGLADRAGAPHLAGELIKFGFPIGLDPRAIAAYNITLLRDLPESGVPRVVVDGQAVDGNSDWLARLPS